MADHIDHPENCCKGCNTITVKEMILSQLKNATFVLLACPNKSDVSLRSTIAR